MSFLWDGVTGALHLIAHPDAELRSIVSVTLQLGVASTVLAMALGVPLGVLLGLGRFRGRRLLLALANGGLGLPPVVVGLVVALLLFNQGPLGGLHLIYTIRGMVLAQLVLSLPLVVALVASAVEALDAGLLAQARALGAGRVQLAAFAVRESRTGVVAAIAALGSALSEVGAVVVVGGNINLQTRTAAGAVLNALGEGEYAQGIAVGLLLLGIVLVLAGGLTLAQYGRPGDARRASLAVGGR